MQSTETTRTIRLTVGDQVRIERDEARWPSKGAWPQFRGKTGMIVQVNLDQRWPRLTEYGWHWAGSRRAPMA